MSEKIELAIKRTITIHELEGGLLIIDRTLFATSLSALSHLKAELGLGGDEVQPKRRGRKPKTQVPAQ